MVYPFIPNDRTQNHGCPSSILVRLIMNKMFRGKRIEWFKLTAGGEQSANMKRLFKGCMQSKSVMKRKDTQHTTQYIHAT